MPRRRVSFAWQVLTLQVGVVVLVVAVGFLLFGWLLNSELTDQLGKRALAVGHSLATDPELAVAVAGRERGGLVQQRAESVRLASGALFVVITDDHGIRLAHRDPSLIGKLVSTPPDALAGRDVVNIDEGTLGTTARGKVPVRDTTGRVVGEVSISFESDDVYGRFLRTLGIAGLYSAGALLIGVAASVLLTRRLRRQTLGLEPHELAELVQEREAVLHGVGEGVLAVDEHGTVSMCNAEAARLLGVRPEPGTPIAEVDLPPRLRAALDGRGGADNLLAVAGNRVLVANLREVRRGGRDLGSVLTLRDRTDLETLTRELDAVRALTDGLRAQRHEFANRLHTLSGLLQLGHHDEAVDYLQALSTGSVTSPDLAERLDTEALRDPYLQAFLAAKATVAEEKGVRLELGEGSWVTGRVVAPVPVTTVVGNLVDNALDAAQLGGRRPARVEIELLGDGPTLHVSVVDSGDGVPEWLWDSVFVEGVSTKDGDGHGLGLALARQAARSHGGELTLAESGGDEHGAVFVARLPGVLREEGA